MNFTKMDRTHSPINSILEQAAYIVRRKKETAGTLEPTESYKKRQTKKLIDLANANNLWISLSVLNVLIQSWIFPINKIA